MTINAKISDRLRWRRWPRRYTGPSDIAINVWLNGKIAGQWVIDGNEYQAWNGTITIDCPIDIKAPPVIYHTKETR